MFSICFVVLALCVCVCLSVKSDVRLCISTVYTTCIRMFCLACFSFFECGILYAFGFTLDSSELANFLHHTHTHSHCPHQDNLLMNTTILCVLGPSAFLLSSACIWISFFFAFSLSWVCWKVKHANRSIWMNSLARICDRENKSPYAACVCVCVVWWAKQRRKQRKLAANRNTNWANNSRIFKGLVANETM